MSQELLPIPDDIWKRIGEWANATENKTHIGSMWAVNAVDEAIKAYALANLQAAKPAKSLRDISLEEMEAINAPADALGGLPVVAWIYGDDYEHGTRCLAFETYAPAPYQQPLSDHAQATEALAKKEAFWKRVVNVADAQTNQYIEKCKALEAKLAGVDGLVEALNDARNYIDAVVFNSSGKKQNNYMGCLNRIDEALATYEAARREK